MYWDVLTIKLVASVCRFKQDLFDSTSCIDQFSEQMWKSKELREDPRTKVSSDVPETPQGGTTRLKSAMNWKLLEHQ